MFNKFSEQAVIAFLGALNGALESRPQVAEVELQARCYPPHKKTKRPAEPPPRMPRPESHYGARLWDKVEQEILSQERIAANHAAAVALRRPEYEVDPNDANTVSIRYAKFARQDLQSSTVLKWLSTLPYMEGCEWGICGSIGLVTPITTELGPLDYPSTAHLDMVDWKTPMLADVWEKLPNDNISRYIIETGASFHTYRAVLHDSHKDYLADWLVKAGVAMDVEWAGFQLKRGGSTLRITYNVKNMLRFAYANL